MQNSHNKATYAGRASSSKRKITEEYQDDIVNQGYSDSGGSDYVAKRPRKIVVEVLPTSTEPEAETPSPPKKSKSIARDLTQIFEETFLTPRKAASWSHSPSPKKGTRMLGKARTESTINISSSSSLSSSRGLERSYSKLENPPTPPPLPHVSEEQPPLVRRTTTTTKRTYAGPSRSFLVAIPPSTSPSTSQQEIDPLMMRTRESYSSLRQRLGVDMSSDPAPPPSPPTPFQSRTPSPTKKYGKKKQQQGEAEPLEDGMMNPLKSITELRSKGEAQKFMDEVGYLIEGLSSNSGLGLRRASALEIITSLYTPEFARKSRSGDFLGITWDLLVCDGGCFSDRIMTTLTTLFATTLATQDESQFLDLAGSREGFVTTLLDVLVSAKESGDSLADEGRGLGRRERALVKTIAKTIRDKELYTPEDVELSTTLLSTTALLQLPPLLLKPTNDQFRDFLGVVVRGEIDSVLAILPSPPLDGMMSDLTEISDSDSNDDHTSSSPRHKQDIVNWLLMTNLLKLLESFLSFSLLEDQDGWIVDALIGVGLVAELEGKEDVMDLTTRLLVTITHHRSLFSSFLLPPKNGLGVVLRRVGVLYPQLQGERENSRQGILDRICLSLALLTNVVQEKRNVEVGGVLSILEIRKGCMISFKECLISPDRCRCHSVKEEEGITMTGMETLIQFYHSLSSVKQEDDTETDADKAFLRGHLAILFGLLIQHSGEEGNHRVPESLDRDTLIKEGRQFLGFFRLAFEDFEDDSEVENVRGVVRFLEGLD